MRPITEPALNIGYHSRIGRSVEENGDFCVATSFLLEGRTVSRQVTVALVADGIGGDARAEEAIQLAAWVVRRYFSQSDSADVLSLLYQAFNEANRVLYERGLSYSEIGGRLGTTLAAAVIVDNRLYTANIGDSRIYLLQPDKELVQATRDHTRAMASDISAELIHPAAPTLERYLGQSVEVTVDFCLRLGNGQTEQQMLGNQGVILQPGALIVLATDGVTDEVPEKKIQALLSEGAPDEAAERLTQAAHRRNRHENASALVMQIPSGEAAPIGWPVQRLVRYAGYTGMGLAMLAVLVLGALRFGVPLVEGMLEPAATELIPTSTPPLETKVLLQPVATEIPPSSSPTPESTNTLLPLILPTQTSTPTWTPTATFTPTSTLAPTPTPTHTVTPIPTGTPRPYAPPPPPPPTAVPPTEEPTEAPTEEPTEAPTDPSPPTDPTDTPVPRE